MDEGKQRGNPNIAEIGKKHQFGAENGPDPVAAAKKKAEGNQTRNSIRHAIRVAIGKDVIDPDNPSIDNDTIRAMFGYKKGDKLSPAQIIAARKVTAAMAGNLKAMQQIEDSVDGKATQTTVQANVTYEELLNKSLEGLDDNQ